MGSHSLFKLCGAIGNQTKSMHSFSFRTSKTYFSYCNRSTVETLLAKQFSMQSAEILDKAQTEQEGIQRRLPTLLETAPEISAKEVRTLYKVLDVVANDLESLSFMTETPLANQRVKKLVKYMLPDRLTSGVIFLIADRFYAKKRRQSKQLYKNEDDHFRRAAVFCWAIEMYMHTINMQDDIIDKSQLRNNKQTWHTLEGAGLQAIRDSRVLTDSALILISKYFTDEDYYNDLINHFIECMYKTDVGITQMEIIRPSQHPLESNSADSLKAGKRYAYGSFFPYGAVVSAMTMNHVKVPELMNTVSYVAFQTGLIAALSEDYIDCFANNTVNQRPTTDIPEGKQTWLYWKALELASPSQAQLLLESYGVGNSDSIATVKNIYKDLCIHENMNQMFEEMAAEIQNLIMQFPHPDVPWNAFQYLVKYYEGVRTGKYSRP